MDAYSCSPVCPLPWVGLAPAGPLRSHFPETLMQEKGNARERAWVPRPNNHTFSRNEMFVGLAAAAEGGRAKQILVSGKCVVFSPRSPKPPTKTLGPQQVRDQFDPWSTSLTANMGKCFPIMR